MEKGNEILEGINEYHTLLFFGYLNYTFFGLRKEWSDDAQGG